MIAIFRTRLVMILENIFNISNTWKFLSFYYNRFLKSLWNALLLSKHLHNIETWIFLWNSSIHHYLPVNPTCYRNWDKKIWLLSSMVEQSLDPVCEPYRSSGRFLVSHASGSHNSSQPRGSSPLCKHKQ